MTTGERHTWPTSPMVSATLIQREVGEDVKWFSLALLKGVIIRKILLIFFEFENKSLFCFSFVVTVSPRLFLISSSLFHSDEWIHSMGGGGNGFVENVWRNHQNQFCFVSVVC
jgi:hypothetical protein